MARRSKTPSFSCELPLILSGDDERVLGVRLDCARQVYNAVLGESLKRLDLLRQSKAYQAARVLPRRTKEERKARAAVFRELDERFGLREYDLHAWAGQFGQSWLGQHLDVNTIQTIATRAFDAVRAYQFGKRGTPRFVRRSKLSGGDTHEWAAAHLLSQRIPSRCPHVTGSLTPTTPAVRKEPGGMQVTQAPLPRSLNRDTRKGKSNRVNASELPSNASSVVGGQ